MHPFVVLIACNLIVWVGSVAWGSTDAYSQALTNDLAAGSGPPALAEKRSQQWRTAVLAAPDATASPGRQYFVEFRARKASNWGHAYVLFGVLDQQGQII